MLLQFLAKKSPFFDLFDQMAGFLVDEIVLLQQLVLERSEKHQLKEIKRLKAEAKSTSATLFTNLHKVFITPFDRHDIHSLNSQLYNAINTIYSVAVRFEQYHIDEIPSHMLALADISEQAAKSVQIVVNNLDKLNNHDLILEHCQRIKKLESDADLMRLQGVTELLSNPADACMLIKKHELYSMMESVTDGFQQIAYLAEGILLEYA